ncbi:Uncharacterised protein [Staphylococcus aureus]|nr:Uncharacterised protein [Staphylococcus aureus]
MFNLNLQYLFTSCLKYVFRNPLKLIVYSYCVGLTLSSGKGKLRVMLGYFKSKKSNILLITVPFLIQTVFAFHIPLFKW